MEDSELEEHLLVMTVVADEDDMVTVGNDEYCLEFQVDFQPTSVGAVLWTHQMCAQGHMHPTPVCMAWRWPNPN